MTKSFVEKHGIEYNEGASTSTMIAYKFFKLATQDPKLKFVVTIQKGNSTISYQPISSSKVKTSPKTTPCYRSKDSLLPLPTITLSCYICGELRHFRPYYVKLTSQPCMKVNVSFSSSPPCTTPQS